MQTRIVAHSSPLALLALALAGMAITITLPANAQTWGRLANPGFENHRMKATLFFAGQARDGTTRYPDCDPGNDAHKFVPPNEREKYAACMVDAEHKDLNRVHPIDLAHWKWSESTANRDVALNLMVQAGINVINMSSWGEDFLTCSWTTGAAPMQTDTRAHDQLFDAAGNKPLFIAPYIETRGGDFPWSFRGEFPYFGAGTISQVINLINRYLKNPAKPEWASKWARVYDRNGEQRHAVVLIHAASDQLGFAPQGSFVDHIAFADGFDFIADQVFHQTGVKVGFFIDALPPGTHAPGFFRPDPVMTGPFLYTTRSMLGIQCFIPELWSGFTETTSVTSWKRWFSQSWFQTGIPFIMDVSPGYDASCVFEPDSRYGMTTEWLNQLTLMNQDFGQAGLVFNAWNGYGESLVAVPTHEYGSMFYDWLRSQLYIDVYARKPDAPAPRQGTFASPYTLPEAVANVPVRGVIGLFATTSAPFNPISIAKPCTLTAVGGSARIGP